MIENSNNTMHVEGRSNSEKNQRLLIIGCFLLVSLGLSAYFLSVRKTIGESRPPQSVINTASSPALPFQSAIKASESSKVSTTVWPTSPMREFYIGLENPLHIVSANIPEEELVVKLIGPGSIKGQGFYHTVEVITPGEVTIAVYHRQQDKEILLSTFIYEVKELWAPGNGC